ncbi:MAG: hypothetical protein ACRDI2_25660 [Chloroflexota bacterium]
MINVTERAAAEFQEILTTKNAPPGHGVKLVPSGSGGVGMTIGAPGDGDKVIPREEGDDPLLIVDGRITDALEGLEIDCKPAEGQPGAAFTIGPATQEGQEEK